jgi:Tol biopolymer transport system component
VKVLDFGLAKAIDGAGGASRAGSGNLHPLTSNLDHSPTLTSPAAMTGVGVILGTAPYMAPEQAKGRTADRRSDIWAFGCVLYEMLTGRRAFVGEDIADTLANVLKSEPDWTLLPADVPGPVRTLLQRCLAKDPSRRIAGASTLRFVIEEAAALSAGAPTPARVPAASRASRLLRLAPVVVASVLAVALAFPAVRHLREVPPVLPELRTDIVTPSLTDPVSFALSPDGTQIVYESAERGPSRLWLRSLASVSGQPLAGTEGGTYPFWSPDGKSIAYFGDGLLKRLDIGSAPRTLTNAWRGRGMGGTWGSDGTIFFHGYNTELFRLPSAGGTPTPVSLMLGSERLQGVHPSMLPDGRHFVFSTVNRGIGLGTIGADAVRQLTTPSLGAPDISPQYLDPGWLVWAHGDAVVAQRLNVGEGRLTGEAVTIGDAIQFDSLGRAALSTSRTGMIAYRTPARIATQPTWFDRAGKVLGTVGAPDDATLLTVAVANDGHRIATVRTIQGNVDVWLLDGARRTRFTVDPGQDTWPVWSPDGENIFFAAQRGAGYDMFVKPSNGSGEEQPLVRMQAPITIANDWSSDGRFLLFHSVGTSPTNRDIWALPMQGNRPAEGAKPRAVVNTPFDERYGAFSPDVRWVAYESDESGRMEVYVRAFADGATGQWQVSTAGGIHPRWRKDGRELYYVAPDGTLMAVAASAAGRSLAFGDPEALFKTDIVGRGEELSFGIQYDVTRDGRFVVNRVVDSGIPSITLLQHWRGQH